jgi:hypothetical protein
MGEEPIGASEDRQPLTPVEADTDSGLQPDAATEAHADATSDADAPAAAQEGDAQFPADPDTDETAVSRREALSARRRAALEARDRRTWIWLSLAGAGVLALFLLGFWPVMAGRLEAAKQLDQAAALLGQASGTVGIIDKVVVNQLSAEPTQQIPDTAAEAAVARRELKQALALLDDAMPHLTEDEQRRGELVRTAVQARLQMLDSAPAILKTSVRAVRAKELADSTALQIKKADESEAKANTLYDQQTAVGVQDAGVLYGAASESLRLARTSCSQAATAFAEADFSAYIRYIDLRLAALETAKQSTTVWLAGDTAGGALLHKAYESQSKLATAAAKKLPDAPSRVVGDAFKKVAGGSRSAYEKARTQAQDAELALKG